MISELKKSLSNKFKLIVFLGFFIAISIFSVLSFYVYRNNLAQLESAKLVSHTTEVLLATERLLDNLFEAEASQRGFIITGDEIFLNPYFAAIDSMNYHIRNLKALTSDNPIQQSSINELEPIIEKRLQIMDENLELRKEAGFEISKESLLSLTGKKLMTNIKTIIQRMQKLEDKLLVERRAQAALETDTFNATYFSAITIVGIILVGTFIVIYNNVLARDHSEKALIQYKNELEQMVEARTNELVKSNETLARNSELLNDMGKLSKVGGWELDMENMIVEWTDEVYRIHELEPGHKPSVAEGINYYAPEARPVIQEAVNLAITTGKGWNLELPFITSKGNQLWVRAIGNAEFKDGKTVRVFGTFQDITEQKKTRDQIKKLNEELEKRVEERTAQLEYANKELESFSYSVSHDLRAPLRSINGYANALIEDHAPKLDDDGKRMLGIVINSAKRMGQLIDDLLTFSRLGRQSLSKAEMNMDDLVKQIVDELLAEENGRKIALEIKVLGKAMADTSMLRQVWLNLLSNALKYSKNKKKSIIEVGRLDGNIKTDTFYVRDNGAGFDMAYNNKLFGVFQRLHKISEFEGTGVGLALAKRIIDKHGGEIWAEAEVDKGATFYFSLPNTK